MAGLVQTALKHTPLTEDTRKTIQCLSSMNRTFVAHFEGIQNTKASEKVIHEAVLPTITIRFDGGTPCNIPSKGYGKGYGSYRINEEEIQRLQFNQAMSANTAEIRTVAEAIEYVKLMRGTNHWLHIIGDSQIALKWVKNAFEKAPMKVSKGSSPLFQDAIKELYVQVDGFANVITEWQPRARMVEVFGH